MVKKFETFDPQPKVVERLEGSAVLTNEAKLCLYKKSQKSGIDTGILEEVYYRGYSIWNEDFGGTPEQFAFDRVNSFIAGGFAADLDEDLVEVLSKNAPASEYIHDFVHSDNPKFKGKSKKKRIKMALAAYYQKEEVSYGTKERAKHPNVGRPWTAKNALDPRSTLRKQGEIQTKIIDEAAKIVKRVVKQKKDTKGVDFNPELKERLPDEA